MTDTVPTALSLFLKFLPKFNTIEWEPFGFRLGEQTSEFSFSPAERHDFSYYNSSSINIRKAKVPFTFTFDPADKRCPTTQMLHSCWKAIQDGPFKGRAFRAEPDIEDLKRSFSEARSDVCIGVKYVCDGDPISGLTLSKDWKASWNFFIPRTSPEGKAITAAISLEWAIKRRQERSAQVRELNENELGQKLELALQLVAT